MHTTYVSDIYKYKRSPISGRFGGRNSICRSQVNILRRINKRTELYPNAERNHDIIVYEYGGQPTAGSFSFERCGVEASEEVGERA